MMLGALLVSAPLHAADLQVSPNHFNFAPGNQSQQLWLSNSGDQPIQAQVRLFSWSQNLDGDVLTPSQDFALSPAMISIAPGQKQLVRVIYRGGSTPDSSVIEHSYRLWVDELPIDDRDAPTSGVNYVFRYSLPVFVSLQPEAAQDPHNAVSWWLQRSVEGLRLRIHNPGQQHIQIANLGLIAGEQVLSINQGLFGYVLAGQRREWQLAIDSQTLDGASARFSKIRATVNGTPVESPISAWPDAD